MQAVQAWQCCLLLVRGVSHSTVCGSCHHGNGLCLASPIPALSSCLGGGYKACTHSSLPHILLFSPVEYAVGALMAEEDPYHIRGGRDRGGAGGGVICCCVMCTHKWRDCVGAGAVQLIAVLTRCGNSLLRPTDCVCVYICSSLTLIRGSLMSRPVHSSVTHMTCVAGAMCPYLLVAQWGGILLLHQWCARSVGNVLPWRYQLEGAGLCLCILTTVGLVAV